MAREYHFPYDHCIDFILSPAESTTTSTTPTPTTMFIHGGDIWDKGGFDLYVIRQLLDFKRRYPSRVHFVMGNRDVNKLRVLQELGLGPTATPTPKSSSSSQPAESSPPMTARSAGPIHYQQEEATTSSDSIASSSSNVPLHGGLWWLRGTGRVGYPENKYSIPSTAVDRLKWLLSQTMGSPNAFEYRKEELQWERKYQRPAAASCQDEVSDDDVVESYRKSCHPNGEIGQFLSQARLAIKLGQALFVHGAIPLTKGVVKSFVVHDTSTAQRGENFWNDMTFAMPWLLNDQDATRTDLNDKNNTEGRSNVIDQWIESLNEFAKNCLEQWKIDIAKTEQVLLRRHQPTIDSNKTTSATTKDDSIMWATKGGYGDGKNASALIQYGMARTPDFERNPTVVYNSWFTNGMHNRYVSAEEEATKSVNSYNPCPYRQLTKEFFEAAQLRLIVCGHQPQGDMPNPLLVDSIQVNDRISKEQQHCNTQRVVESTNVVPSIRTETTGYILCCDTSYSAGLQWIDDSATKVSETKTDQTTQRRNLGRGDAKSFRGSVAVSEVLIELDDETNDLLGVRYHGVLSDGMEYEHTLFEESPSSEDPPPDDDEILQRLTVGKVTPDSWAPAIDQSPHRGRWWTKAIFKDGSHLLYATEGFKTWNYYAPALRPKDGPATDR